jgi:hypothetical protein
MITVVLFLSLVFRLSEDLNQTDDLRVLDYNGDNVFYNFKLSEMGKPVYHEEGA